MKAIDFAYWLQGYFELSGGQLTTEKQLGQVLEKANKVKLTGGDATEQQAVAFTMLTKGYLTAVDRQQDKAFALKSMSDLISGELNKLFIHAIDPSYEGDQSGFNSAHNGNGGFPPRQPGMRC